MSVTIRHGDCREVLRTLPDESVHCCVTSPPYFGLRDYGVAGQIGLEPTPDAFVAEMVAVFREVRRVLRDDGTLFLNLGDSYFGSSTTGGTKSIQGSSKRRGAMFSKREAVQRAGACDTIGKEPEGSPANDCLCQNLCGACREAYRIGKSHNDGSPASKQPASSSASSLGHTVSPSGHLPTSGLIRPDARNSAAIPDLALTADPELGPLPADLESTNLQSAAPSRAGRLLASTPDAGCQLCGCSLPDCDLATVDSSACTCDIGLPLGASNQGKSGKSSSGLAYPNHTTTSLKPKDLIGIPWRVAFALQADGWYLRQDIIWNKPNPMPESVTDRCTKAHEYIFLLSKSPSYYYDHELVKEATSQPLGIPKLTGQHKADAGGFTTNGTGASTLGSNQGNEKRNRRSVWTVTTKPYKGAHFATFPPALIEPCIKAGCPDRCCSKCGSPWVRQTDGASYYDAADIGSDPQRKYGNREHGRGPKNNLGASIAKTVGWLPSCACDAPTVAGTVLDPFGGAGTTGMVADRLGRNAILIELNSEYAAIAERRINADGGLFAQVAAE